jgi:hypothetical protein
MTCHPHRLTGTAAMLVTMAALSTAMLAASAWAAPMRERVRGTVVGITGDTLTVRTMAGDEVPVMLTAATHYSEVLKSSLDRVDPGSYIGTATKSLGNELVALEVVVFPPAMRGVGEGHYGWDRIPDTTLGERTTTGSAMTNGTVSAATPAAASVGSTMTNGTITSANTTNQAKEVTVTYKGGQQVILVPPTAPIVTLRPASMANVKAGSIVFISALNDAGKDTAVAVVVGSEGVKPPM